MTAAHGVNVTISRSKRQTLTAQRAPKISAKSAALAAARGADVVDCHHDHRSRLGAHGLVSAHRREDHEPYRQTW
jgi:hypothetical protein